MDTVQKDYYKCFFRQIFTELVELELVSGEWVEKARWIKHEQTVERGRGA